MSLLLLFQSNDEEVIIEPKPIADSRHNYWDYYGFRIPGIRRPIGENSLGAHPLQVYLNSNFADVPDNASGIGLAPIVTAQG